MAAVRVLWQLSNQDPRDPGKNFPWDHGDHSGNNTPEGGGRIPLEACRVRAIPLPKPPVDLGQGPLEVASYDKAGASAWLPRECWACEQLHYGACSMHCKEAVRELAMQRLCGSIS